MNARLAMRSPDNATMTFASQVAFLCVQPCAQMALSARRLSGVVCAQVAR